MDTLTINIDDIEALAAKLESIIDTFDEHERNSLEALFVLAGMAVHDSGDVEGFSFSWGAQNQGILVSSSNPGGTQGILIGLNQAFQMGQTGQFGAGGGGGAGQPIGGQQQKW